MYPEPRNPEETDDEKMAADLIKGAQDNLGDDPMNAQTNLADKMTEGNPDMGRSDWKRPWTWTVWRKRF